MRRQYKTDEQPVDVVDDSLTKLPGVFKETSEKEKNIEK